MGKINNQIVGFKVLNGFPIMAFHEQNPLEKAIKPLEYILMTRREILCQLAYDLCSHSLLIKA